jgi:uncharacterized damage-inducible protein DinB
MPPRIALRAALSLLMICCFGALAYGQNNADAKADAKAIILKHLATSRDFTLKVAEQMPAADYSFKLTPAQMSFGEQMVHLAQTFDEFIAPPSGKKLDVGMPASMNKPDVTAFLRKGFAAAIERVSTLSPEQLSNTYTSYGTTATGLEFLMELLDHTTQHRASAEMYLRAKGITPSAYEF